MKLSTLASTLALSLMTACVGPSLAPAAEAPTINDIINATNFVVANQCSGTLISSAAAGA